MENEVDREKIFLHAMHRSYEFITTLADRYIKNDDEKIIFTRDVVVNLLGNTVISTSKNNLESLKINATETIKAMSEWFDLALKDIKEKKRKEQ